MTTDHRAAKLENIISGHAINSDDADWLRAIAAPAPAQPEVYRRRTDAEALDCADRLNRSFPPSSLKDEGADHIRELVATLNATQAQAAPALADDEDREPAPPHGLPSWHECNRIIENDSFRKRAAAGLEGAVLDLPEVTPTPTALHRFIQEYDDSDPYRSDWFMHRLELVLNEAKASPAPVPAPDAQLLIDNFKAAHVEWLSVDGDAEDGVPYARAGEVLAAAEAKLGAALTFPSPAVGADDAELMVGTLIAATLAEERMHEGDEGNDAERDAAADRLIRAKDRVLRALRTGAQQ